jgi:AcrR family transcriptional regulator
MAKSPRTRSARALANDIAIRDAAIESILRVGVDRLSLRDVGHQAGLTHGATYARYEDVDELLVDLWNSTLASHVAAMFELSLAAATDANDDSVGAIFEFLRAQSAADVAAVHVLLVARRIPILHEEVEPFIHKYLEGDGSGSSDSGATHARGLTVFGLLIVHVFGVHQFERDSGYLDELEKLILATLRTNPADVRSGELRSADDRVIPAPSENLKSQLASATFGVVAKSGYVRATITRIARRATCSPGAIYKLYPSKEDLVIAAFRDIMRARWLRASNFVDILEEGSLTQLLYSSASVQNEVRRSFTMETTLASTHSDKIHLAVATIYRELEDAVRGLANVTDEERECLRYMIRAITSLVVGTSWLTTITSHTRDIDFNQFAEPFRRAILRECVPNWEHIATQIRDALSSHLH